MKKPLVASALVIVGGAALAAGLLTEGKLLYSGKEVATDFVVKNGKTYVPLSDVAKALNLSVKKTDDGFELLPKGISGQAEGLNGKVGDQLNCGSFLLKVTEVVETQSFTPEHPAGAPIAPFRDGEKLVVVKFHVQNTTSDTMSLDTLGGDLTALTAGDQNFKTREEDGPRAPDMLRGSSLDFALIYYVPKSTVPKDMVYQLHSYNSTAGYKDYTFRISLKKE
ncbi:MAG TPA: hypothetical protein VKT78_12485 [Fimbriimonadaceae bacterium]|nr:hypothetical protein [Fimbriimonadaceae bacterium]